MGRYGLAAPGIGARDDLLCSAPVYARGGRRPGSGAADRMPIGAAAIRRAEAIARHEANAGAVAFSRSGDPNLGEFETL